MDQNIAFRQWYWIQKQIVPEVVSILGIKQIHSSPYCPQGNGYLENLHNFLNVYVNMSVHS